MAVAEELARIGFTLAGSPPAMTVPVGREEVVMKVADVAEVKGGVHLRAELAVEVSDKTPDLSGATISASGDTTLALSGALLIGTRRLVSPSPGDLYDAIHELAKTIAAAARLMREMADYEANAPAQEESGPTMVAVEYPTPAPAPAPPAGAAPPPAAAAAAAYGGAITSPIPGAAAVPAATPGAFTPTHTVPVGGLPAWNAPDASSPAAATLDAGLAVQLAEQQCGWGRIICENTWSAWVDASKLQPR